MAKNSLTDEEIVRNSRKTLDLAMEQIESEIDTGRGTLDHRVKVRGITSPIRLIVRVRAPRPEGWAMAVIFKEQRIDGIDWEARVEDHRGEQYNCSGWHRHMWKPNGGDIYKECLPAFSPKPGIRGFIIDGFAVLNVQLKEETAPYDHPKLPLD